MTVDSLSEFLEKISSALEQNDTTELLQIRNNLWSQWGHTNHYAQMMTVASRVIDKIQQSQTSLDQETIVFIGRVCAVTDFEWDEVFSELQAGTLSDVLAEFVTDSMLLKAQSINNKDVETQLRYLEGEQ